MRPPRMSTCQGGQTDAPIGLHLTTCARGHATSDYPQKPHTEQGKATHRARNALWETKQAQPSQRMVQALQHCASNMPFALYRGCCTRCSTACRCRWGQHASRVRACPELEAVSIRTGACRGCDKGMALSRAGCRAHTAWPRGDTMQQASWPCSSWMVVWLMPLERQ